MMLYAARLVSLVRHPAVWIPAAVLAIATVLFWTTDLDQEVVGQFFSGDKASPDVAARFPHGEEQPWKSLRAWGVYPAWILGCGGMAVWGVSFIWAKLTAWRDAGLFFALLLIVGPGILVNGVFKPYWNRPRPHATKGFRVSDDPSDPPRDFVPVWRRGVGEDDESFPSGHAAMGFCLMAPAFVFYRRRPWVAVGFLLLGLASGLVIGSARVVAGAHFPSDVLWAGGIVYFTARSAGRAVSVRAREAVACTGRCRLWPLGRVASYHRVLFLTAATGLRALWPPCRILRNSAKLHVPLIARRSESQSIAAVPSEVHEEDAARAEDCVKIVVKFGMVLAAIALALGLAVNQTNLIRPAV